ncbi:MAG: hypothetical protein PHS02_00245 [Candidatus ainarchaeum sp.]|nr:hypothetical protein [Candidatus ainarchaeum sp.]
MSTHESQKKHSDLQDLAEGIRSAENEAEALQANYDSKVAELLKKGRERSVELRESYDKKSADAKNRILSLERQKTEKLVEGIVADAKKQAGSLRSKKLDQKALKSVFQNFISNL